jgi:hypothetical protein
VEAALNSKKGAASMDWGMIGTLATLAVVVGIFWVIGHGPTGVAEEIGKAVAAFNRGASEQQAPK